MTSPDPARAHPIFGRAAPLDPARHGTLKLDRDAGFAFAADQTAVPLVVTEFATAARDLPIVFAGDDMMPMAVLGLREGQNLMIGERGAWRPGRYVPAHLRRYPFILQEDPAQQRFVLCIDETAPHLASSSADAVALFDGEAPAPVINETLTMLGELQAGFGKTVEYVAALKAENLLVPRNASVQLKNGERLSLDGFHVIDDERFTNLPDDRLPAWTRNGWLAMSYFHLQSRLNWSHLVDLAG